MTICPNCGRENQDDRSWCSYCRKPLRMYRSTGKAPQITPLEPTGDKENIRAEGRSNVLEHGSSCERCGKPIGHGAKCCPECSNVAAPASKSARNVKASNKPAHRISPVRELLLLTHEGFLILVGEPRNLIISLLFPVAAAAVTIWIAGENMFVNCESTKSACFILVCAAIWGGLFNSIQTVVKERDNVKRDYVSGALRIECFMISRAVIQLVLCAIQSAVLCISFYGVHYVYENELPAEGLIFAAPIIEYFITVFLVMYASDAMGLMISCIVKSEQLASQLSPYILIVQLLFSGVLFEMKGAASSVSALMVSRWGMESLGSISDLNSLPLRIQEEFPMATHEADEAFAHTAEHLTNVWLVLLIFVVVPLIIGTVCLHQVKKDKRD